MDLRPVNNVLVLGGGSAGFMAALALKVKLPSLRVTVIRSKDIGIIGVGEGSTVPLTSFLHDYLAVGMKKFHETAQPTWKLGLKFIRWGPRPFFFYTFGAQQPDARSVPGLARPVGFYCNDGSDDAGMIYDKYGAMMSHDHVFERAQGGAPGLHGSVAYHFENEKFVRFLEDYAAALGVTIVEETVAEVRRDDRGVAALVMQSGGIRTADLYVDCSGFTSLLVGKALGEPFVDFRASLFCDRAVVGGWDRGDEVIKPYTACETMDAGWCWQIEPEHRIN